MILELAGRLAFCIFIPILALRLYRGRKTGLKDWRYRGAIGLLMVMIAAVWIYSLIEMIALLRAL